MATIGLEDLRFYAFHGCFEEERAIGTHFRVDAWLKVDTTKSQQSDNLDDTVSYLSVYQTIKQEMEIPSKLLEHVAGRIVSAIEKRFPQVTSIDLELTKQNPPMGADCDGAGVEIHLINDKTE